MSKYIKSPFNYIGGKYKILPEIIPEFPKSINTFYDVFGGGFNVGINVNANKIIYNDIVPYVKNVYENMSATAINYTLQEIDDLIVEYDLSKENEQGFLKLREDYNNGKNDWLTFYVLTCYSFNYQYRFNNNHQYNSSFGRNRSSYTVHSKEKVIAFMEKLHNSNVEFWNKNYNDIDYHQIQSSDFVFFDPPYLITTGNYNDGKRGFEGWSIEDEHKIYEICNDLHKRGVKFGLTNVTHHKGKTNDILIKWIVDNNFKVKELNNGFAKSYNSKNDGITKEVYISNA